MDALFQLQEKLNRTQRIERLLRLAQFFLVDSQDSRRFITPELNMVLVNIERAADQMRELEKQTS